MALQYNSAMPHLFEQCHTFSSLSGLVGLMFFLLISSPMSTYVKHKQCLK